MVAIKNRFLIPKVNNQVTEPLVEKVNSTSQLSLPVMITQALLRAAKEETGGTSASATTTTANTKAGFSIHDAMQYDDDDDEEERDIEEIIEEEEDEYPRTPEYIDVSEQGTISNASRLDRVLLKDKKKYKLPSKSTAMMTSADVSYLFDTNIPPSQRETLLMKFELPLDTRNQLVGALTALNILLENEQIIRNMVSEESFKYPNTAIVDHLMMDIDSENFAITKPKTTTSSTPTSTKLPENICQLIQNLVQLSAYPALDEWASIHHRKYPLNIITEAKASGMYNDVIDWICSCAELSPRIDHQDGSSDQGFSGSSNNDSSNFDGSSSSDEEQIGFVTIHKQRLHKKRQPSNQNHRRHGRYGHHHRRRRHNTHKSFFQSDDDSNSTVSYSDSEDDDRRMLSAASKTTTSAAVYPQRRKIESAAERMGETRRKGEHLDLDDILSISYASEYYLGFSNRALVLLNSLARHGKP
jgi:hypothetical protein